MKQLLPDPRYEQIERGLAAWARSRADVLAVFVIGSRARTQNPADGMSDLDTIIFADDPAAFSKAGDWQPALEAAFGIPVWFAAFGWTMGDPEWEYVLEGGRKVDLVFTANRASLDAAASPFVFVFERGSRVLFDRSSSSEDSSAQTAPRIAYTQNNPPAPAELPDQAAFNNRIANTLLELVRAAKIARRGELYRAARIHNAELQDNLLALIEMHARGQQRPGADFWQYGRFLEAWADPRALAALPDTHAMPTAESVHRAVLAGLVLLEWLGPETAGLLGLRFPEDMLRPTARWLRDFMG